MIMEPLDPSQLVIVLTSDSGLNCTGWADPEYDQLYAGVKG